MRKRLCFGSAKKDIAGVPSSVRSTEAGVRCVPSIASVWALETRTKFAAGYGGKCLSDDYTNNSVLLRWECAKGHTWQAKPVKIMIGHWCRTCAVERTRLGVEKMHDAAAMHGGKCLSETDVNTITPLEWQCMDGHTWSARPESIIRTGSCCPVCRAVKIAQAGKIRLKFEEGFEGQSPDSAVKSPDWFSDGPGGSNAVTLAGQGRSRP